MAAKKVCTKLNSSGDGLFWLALRRNPRRRLLGQFPAQLRQQNFPIFLQLRVASENQFSAIGCRKMSVHHLDRSKLLQHRPRGETTSQLSQMPTQRYRQTISQESHKDVGFDPALFLVKDRAQQQIIL